MKMRNDEMEDFVWEIKKDLRENLRESKYGRFKLLGWDLVPVVMGATLGGIGRATGAEWLPIVPPALDALGGGFSSLGYCLGVALSYADVLAPLARDYLGNC